MKIALLTYSTKPRGGVVHTLALAEALARAGQDVTVWTLGRGGDTTFYRAVDPAVSVCAVPFPAIEGEAVGARILRSIAVLAEAFSRRLHRYDVVHAQDCISANAALEVSDECVRTVHHLDQFTTPELVACHDRAITRPYAHICVSAAVAREVAAGWGKTPAVIPNGVDWQRFSSGDGAPWRRRFGAYVLAVGGIEPRKGSLDLLEAYAALRCPVPLVIAGGETLFDYRDYRAHFDSRAAALGIEPVLLGTVADGDMPGLIAGAAVLPFFSTKEGFGLAAMEALAAGVSVVARDLPVLREVFSDQVEYAADVAAMAAALARALTGEFEFRRASGSELARSFSWDTAAAAHVAFYGARR
ncbi:MAG: MSMEG_0565 family glycosyltransferase [Mycobacterium sp.]